MMFPAIEIGLEINTISLMYNDSMLSAGGLSERLGVPASFVYRAVRSLSAELRERGMMRISGWVSGVFCSRGATSRLLAVIRLQWLLVRVGRSAMAIY